MVMEFKIVRVNVNPTTRWKKRGSKAIKWPSPKDRLHVAFHGEKGNEIFGR
jgi:hypothetical protein